MPSDETAGPTRTARSGRAPQFDAAPELPLLDPRRLVLGDRHAHGGLGEILRAEDRLLGREVAVKQLLRQNDRAASVRFLREAIVTARLQHPGIVPIYDAGQLPSGSPYYAMKMVSGQSLRDVIAEAATTDDRLALVPHVLAVADAVAYAHERGIIHRDLKPSNVMVGKFGETVVIDWGLAKELREGGDGAAAPSDTPELARGTPDVTHTGDVLGTPAYMAPEQARGEALDERADVYAIGAILYHLLAGQRPYPGKSSDQIMARVLAGPPVPLAEREPEAPADLIAVVDKAMARTPDRRYRDAGELAADLRRFQRGQLVGARRYSRLALLRRWLGRHRTAVGVAAVLTLVLIATATASAVRIVHESEQVKAASNQLRLLHARSELGGDPTAAVAWLERFEAGAADAPEVADIAARAAIGGVARDVFTMPERAALVTCLSPDARYVVAGDRDGILWQWDTDTRVLRRLGQHDFRPSRCSFTRDGRFVISTTHRGGSLIAAVPDGSAEPLPGPASIERFNAVQGQAALVASDSEHNVHWIDLGNREARLIGKAPQRLGWLAASPDGTRLALAGVGGGVWLMDAASGALTELAGHQGVVGSISFSPDGARVLSGGADNVAIHDLATGTVTRSGDFGLERAVVIASFAYDGVIYYDSHSLSVRWWRPDRGEPEVIGTEVSHDIPLVTNQGRRVVWTTLDGTVWARDLDSGYRWQLPGHRGSVRRISVTPDGLYLASTGADETVRVWRLPATTPRILPVAGEQFYVQPAGKAWIATGDEAGRVRLWRASTGEVRELGKLAGNIVTLATSRDGATIAAGSNQGEARVWSVGGEAPWDVPLPDGPASWISIADDGVVYAANGTRMRAWRRGDDGPIEVGSYDARGKVTHDGRFAPSWGFRGIRIDDLERGESRDIETPGGMVFAFATSPEQRRFAAGTADGLIRIIAARSPAVDEVGRMEGYVDSLDFSPDGRRILAGDETGALITIDLDSGATRSFPGHESSITSASFSADGQLMATGDNRGVLRVWRVADGAAAVLPGHDARIFGLHFLDDETLVTSAADGQARVWQVPRELAPTDPAALRAWITGATSARVDDAGRLETPVTRIQEP